MCVKENKPWQLGVNCLTDFLFLESKNMKLIKRFLGFIARQFESAPVETGNFRAWHNYLIKVTEADK